MYDILSYGQMLLDRSRVAAYHAALRAAVRPGMVVADIGCGTGYFTLLACELGARRVYAIEPNEAIHVARDAVQAAGCADRVEFFEGVSTAFQPAERADVIVSDLRGVLPLYFTHVAALADARERLLAPGGTLICRRDTLRVVPVQAKELYEEQVGPWRSAAGDLWRQARVMACNTQRKAQFEAGQLLAEPCTWAELDYGELRTPDVAGRAEWTFATDVTAHGLCLWFDAELAGGFHYSNQPPRKDSVYGSAFQPWPEEVAIRRGDRVQVELRAQLSGERYEWFWNTDIVAADGARRAAFRQGTPFARPLTPRYLRRRMPDYAPACDERGDFVRWALGRMNGHSSLETIAIEAAQVFPARFPRAADALTRLTELADEYAR